MSGPGDGLDRLEGCEPVALLRSAGVATDAWLVGGVVRDALLGRPLRDFDLATSGPSRGPALRLAEHAGADVFLMSEEHGTWRVLGGGWTVDLTPVRGGEIDVDLAQRDLTVNAIAVPAEGGPPLDPAGGIEDLRAARLRAVSDGAFADDPLRLLRLVRLAAELGFTVEAGTASLARRFAERASEPAGERQFAELRSLIGGPDPVLGIELADELGILERVLPELHALHGVEQSRNHHLDTYDHTIEVLRRWLQIEADLSSYVPGLEAAVDRAISEPLADELSRREGIRFAAILHDIGKPSTRTEREGWVSFKGHDRVGAEMIHRLCRRLRTSRRFAEFEAALCRHHLVLGFMVRERPLPPRRVWDYASTCGTEMLDITLLTMADRLSAKGGGEDAIRGHLELAAEMCDVALELERDGWPEPPLDGLAVAELLEVEPGPIVGEALSELRAARFAGEIGDPDSAAAHLRRWATARHDG